MTVNYTSLPEQIHSKHLSDRAGQQLRRVNYFSYGEFSRVGRFWPSVFQILAKHGNGRIEYAVHDVYDQAFEYARRLWQ